MVNEQGLARDSTLVFTKGVVDVNTAVYVEGHHSGQSAFGGPRVVIFFLAIGKNEVRSWAGEIIETDSPGENQIVMGMLQKGCSVQRSKQEDIS
jgi:hypothetical protein